MVSKLKRKTSTYRRSLKYLLTYKRFILNFSTYIADLKLAPNNAQTLIEFARSSYPKYFFYLLRIGSLGLISAFIGACSLKNLSFFIYSKKDKFFNLYQKFLSLSKKLVKFNFILLKRKQIMFSLRCNFAPLLKVLNSDKIVVNLKKNVVKSIFFCYTLKRIKNSIFSLCNSLSFFIANLKKNLRLFHAGFTVTHLSNIFFSIFSKIGFQSVLSFGKTIVFLVYSIKKTKSFPSFWAQHKSSLQNFAKKFNIKNFNKQQNKVLLRASAFLVKSSVTKLKASLLLFFMKRLECKNKKKLFFLNFWTHCCLKHQFMHLYALRFFQNSFNLRAQLVVFATTISAFHSFEVAKQFSLESLKLKIIKNFYYYVFLENQVRYVAVTVAEKFLELMIIKFFSVFTKRFTLGFCVYLRDPCLNFKLSFFKEIFAHNKKFLPLALGLAEPMALHCTKRKYTADNIVLSVTKKFLQNNVKTLSNRLYRNRHRVKKSIIEHFISLYNRRFVKKGFFYKNVPQRYSFRKDQKQLKSKILKTKKFKIIVALRGINTQFVTGRKFKKLYIKLRSLKKRKIKQLINKEKEVSSDFFFEQFDEQSLEQAFKRGNEGTQSSQKYNYRFFLYGLENPKRPDDPHLLGFTEREVILWNKKACFFERASVLRSSLDLRAKNFYVEKMLSVRQGLLLDLSFYLNTINQLSLYILDLKKKSNSDASLLTLGALQKAADLQKPKAKRFSLTKYDFIILLGVYKQKNASLLLSKFFRNLGNHYFFKKQVASLIQRRFFSDQANINLQHNFIKNEVVHYDFEFEQAYFLACLALKLIYEKLVKNEMLFDTFFLPLNRRNWYRNEFFRLYKIIHKLTKDVKKKLINVKPFHLAYYTHNNKYKHLWIPSRYQRQITFLFSVEGLCLESKKWFIHLNTAQDLNFLKKRNSLLTERSFLCQELVPNFEKFRLFRFFKHFFSLEELVLQQNKKDDFLFFLVNVVKFSKLPLIEVLYTHQILFFKTLRIFNRLFLRYFSFDMFFILFNFQYYILQIYSKFFTKRVKKNFIFFPVVTENRRVFFIKQFKVTINAFSQLLKIWHYLKILKMEKSFSLYKTKLKFYIKKFKKSIRINFVIYKDPLQSLQFKYSKAHKGAKIFKSKSLSNYFLRYKTKFKNKKNVIQKRSF